MVKTVTVVKQKARLLRLPDIHPFAHLMWKPSDKGGRPAAAEFGCVKRTM
jgi:hypothetical protein